VFVYLIVWLSHFNSALLVVNGSCRIFFWSCKIKTFQLEPESKEIYPLVTVETYQDTYWWIILKHFFFSINKACSLCFSFCLFSKYLFLQRSTNIDEQCNNVVVAWEDKRLKLLSRHKILRTAYSYFMASSIFLTRFPTWSQILLRADLVSGGKGIFRSLQATSWNPISSSSTMATHLP